ncbi:hypothetical protein DPMN_097475 [Dreissena polymorpha]|uniref:Uncharacterized protein n=1 Tax=Dreissena polymorpha TaxID=45954 RepID=A0A9D4LBU1_DREPO|nr:hypothetical protein DPMN_097475 [Dreissena polymorpha]
MGVVVEKQQDRANSLFLHITNRRCHHRDTNSIAAYFGNKTISSSTHSIRRTLHKKSTVVSMHVSSSCLLSLQLMCFVCGDMHHYQEGSKRRSAENVCEPGKRRCQ